MGKRLGKAPSFRAKPATDRDESIRSPGAGPLPRQGRLLRVLLWQSSQGLQDNPPPFLGSQLKPCEPHIWLWVKTNGTIFGLVHHQFWSILVGIGMFTRGTGLCMAIWTTSLILTPAPPPPGVISTKKQITSPDTRPAACSRGTGVLPRRRPPWCSPQSRSPPFLGFCWASKGPQGRIVGTPHLFGEFTLLRV